MAILEFLLLISLGAIGGFFVLNYLSSQRQKKKLDAAFYQLLSTQGSTISLIQLAAAARVDAKTAQEYLEQQAVIFSALLDLNEEGETFYRFPKLKLPPQLLDEGW